MLFRFTYGAGAFTRTLRRPLLPRHAAPMPTGIIASHRVLRQSHWSYVPRVVVDDVGRARGGGHRGPTLAARRRLVLVGRVSTAPLPEDGHGWNGFLVHLVDGETAPRLRVEVDLERSAALSDVAAHGEAGWVVAGRSGYWQNPRGASISEEATSELLLLDGAGAVHRRRTLPQGARHNAALGLAPLPGRAKRYLVGGLSNGPGSHSADGDPALLQADGWLLRAALD